MMGLMEAVPAPMVWATPEIFGVSQVWGHSIMCAAT